MEHGHDAIHSKSMKLVVALVAAGVIVLGIGAFFALSKRSGGATVESDDAVAQWCKLRQQWAKEVDALAADIALKSVNEADRDEKEKLEAKRDQICRDYAQRVQKLGVGESGVVKVEEVLVREGKTRANTAVEIQNQATVLADDIAAEDNPDVGGRLERLRGAQENITERIKQRIEGGKAKADAMVNEAAATLGGCPGLYRGPITDKGTSANPYTSWQELELRREKVAKAINERIRMLEPREQFANHVYHELMRRYRPTLHKCFQKARKRRSGLSGKVQLQIRLRGNGVVRSLGVVDMTADQEVLLDCLLQKAAKWRLPRPGRDNHVVILSMDFTAI